MKTFRYYVGRSAGLRLEMDIYARMYLDAGFNDEIHAKAFAAVVADGLNFVTIYDGDGKMLMSFSPNKTVK